MKLDAVIFDMDGLLINSELYWWKANKMIFDKKGIDLTWEEYEKTIGLPTHESVQILYEEDLDTNSIKKMSDQIVQKAHELILAEANLMEGVNSTLNLVKNGNFKVGLASSSPIKLIEGILRKFNLYNSFNAIHSADNHHLGKPHPAIYLSCAKELEVRPVNCLVFEDSITGLIAAKAAKMRVIAVPEKNNYDNPQFSLADYKLSSLAEFNLNVIRKIEDL